MALYRAKGERRSAFRFFEEAIDDVVRQREQLERELRAAVEADAVGVRFRPSHDLRSGAVVSLEAVPASVAADGTEIPAERFLPVAEETGLIHRLAATVLRKACEAAAGWPRSVTLSIDLFPGQLSDRDVGRTVLSILGEIGIDPRRLEIEIGESMLVRDLEAARTVLGSLRAAGVRVAVDNFGTGYSSLYHMQELRLDRVKIDRRLVQGMGDAEAERVVRALAGLGHGLGLAVAADGIASADGALLVSSGIDEGQSTDELISAEGIARLFGAS
ncbi:MAG: EAL domain-containing protein [Alphaproteobacteria bacterium]